MKEKENLEFNAVMNFIEEYNRIHNEIMIFKKLSKPPMPDAFCDLSGTEIGIEIVHSYGSNDEAKIRLGKCKYKDIPEKRNIERTTTPLNVRAINCLNEQLHKKSAKTYKAFITWLLIRNAFAVWSKDDYESYRDEIWVPDNHPFDQIWLLCDRNSVGEKGIIRLY